MKTIIEHCTREMSRVQQQNGTYKLLVGVFGTADERLPDRVVSHSS